MAEPPGTAQAALPDVPGFRCDLCAYLRDQEPKLWEWFSRNRVRQEQAEAVRMELLKQTYRIERPSAQPLYETADAVTAALGVDAPVTFYRADGQGMLNASLAYIPGEVHIVLLGPVTDALDEAELRGVLGHELGHYLLAHRDEGEHLIAAEIVNAMVLDHAAETVHEATARRVDLFGEVFADRVSLHVVGDLRKAIASLVKMETGVSDADPESYLRQAGEVVAAGPVASEGITHPECYIRVEALRRWADEGPEAEVGIAEMVRGPLDLDQLDLLGQQTLAGHTRQLIEAFLSPQWFHSEEVLAHARLFFEGVAPKESAAPDGLSAIAAAAGSSVREYFCYVLLDFVAAGRDLEPVPLAWALEFAKTLGLDEPLDRIAHKELSLRKNQLDLLRRQGPGILEKAREQARRAGRSGDRDAG